MWGGGAVPPNTMNAAGLYLQLLALFTLTIVPSLVKFLAKTISEINTKQGVLKLMMGALRLPILHNTA